MSSDQAIWLLKYLTFVQLACHNITALSFDMTLSCTCVQPLFQLLDLIGGARLPVDALGVEAVHLYVVDELLHHKGHSSLIIGQSRNLNTKLP